MTDTVRFQIPGYIRPPLSLNDRRGHWAPRHRTTQTLRAIAATLTRQETRARRVRVMPPVVIDLVWVVTDNRHRDTDNPVLTRKPLVDGVCDVLGFPDHWRNVSGGVRIEKGATAGIWVEIRPAATSGEATA
ncbi:hypothetical protein [Cumulibacter soli]|uniref:hypothetical protein n=1 Tax=Cumulibacter soli TaxID=2546344 RepID=UPI0010684C21|nr:hypothetical protein [Cumulibacter soli]